MVLLIIIHGLWVLGVVLLVAQGRGRGGARGGKRRDVMRNEK